MGLAASQARFLTLTARKSNVEYQGQQINEQRLLLANKSAALQTQMLTLAVPTPPVQTKFMHMSSVVKVGDQEYYISQEDWNNIPTLLKNGDEATDVAVKYKDTYNVDPSVYYVSKNTAISGTYTDKDGNQTTQEFYVMMCDKGSDVGTATSPSVVDGKVVKLALTTDKIEGGTTPFPTQDSVDLFYNNKAVEMQSGQVEIFDEAGYNDAYNEYKYQQFLYEKQLEDINAQTAGIHQQDKTLELQLKQLDTEQSALKTEMDAVSKVVKDHVESGFKTFGG